MSNKHAERLGAIHRDLHSHLTSEPALRVKTLESLLVEKGLLDPKTVDAWIVVYTEEIGPKRGAEVVASLSYLRGLPCSKWRPASYCPLDTDLRMPTSEYGE